MRPVVSWDKALVDLLVVTFYQWHCISMGRSSARHLWRMTKPSQITSLSKRALTGLDGSIWVAFIGIHCASLWRQVTAIHSSSCDMCHGTISGYSCGQPAQSASDRSRPHVGFPIAFHCLTIGHMKTGANWRFRTHVHATCPGHLF